MDTASQLYTALFCICFLSFSTARRWDSSFLFNALRPRVTRQADQAEGLFFKDDESIPEVTVASKHDSIVLECKCGGSEPTIHWLKDGIRIQQGDTRDYMDDQPIYEQQNSNLIRKSFTNSRLFLDCVNEQTVGRYTCVGESPTERITRSTELVLDDGPSVRPRQCRSKRSLRETPARIYLWTSLRVEKMGAELQLFCRTQGNPKPDIIWFDNRGREILPEDEDYQLLENGDLAIRELKWSQMGSFKCRASNRRGTDEQTEFIYPTA